MCIVRREAAKKFLSSPLPSSLMADKKTSPKFCFNGIGTAIKKYFFCGFPKTWQNRNKPW